MFPNRVRQVEVTLSGNLSKEVSVAANYTYTETVDETTGAELLRRARNKSGLDLVYTFPARSTVSLGVIYVGSRHDNDFSSFPATRVKLDEYVLARIAASIDVSETLQLFGRIENLLDESYEQVNGFGTPGFAGYIGLEMIF